MVGRVSEGLAPGFGGISLVTFARGTLVAPLAGVSFEAVPAATLSFGAFLLAWSRRPGLAGLVGGAAVLIEYQSGLTVVVVGLYVALGGWRPLLAFVTGLVPAGLLLALRLGGVRGAVASLVQVCRELLGWTAEDGVLRDRAAAPFRRRRGLRREGRVARCLPGGRAGRLRARVAWPDTPRRGVRGCGRDRDLRLHDVPAISTPYGGGSPGPRFLASALPFLALGVWTGVFPAPSVTLVLGVLSVIPTTALTLAWAVGGPARGGVWGELARVPVQLGSARLVERLSPNALTVIGPVWAALLVAACAAGALVVAARGMPWAQIRARREVSGRRGASLRAMVATGSVRASSSRQTHSR